MFSFVLFSFRSCFTFRCGSSVAVCVVSFVRSFVLLFRRAVLFVSGWLVLVSCCLVLLCVVQFGGGFVFVELGVQFIQLVLLCELVWFRFCSCFVLVCCVLSLGVLVFTF